MLFPSDGKPEAWVVVFNNTGKLLVTGTEVSVPAPGLVWNEPLLVSATGAVDRDIPHGQQGLMRLHSATFHKD
jgi:hypothetical protein